MFTEIFLFEIKYRLRRPATWFYFLILAALAFLMANVFGGAFDEVSASTGGSGGNIKANAPFQIYVLITAISYYGILIVSAIMGNPIYRDFEHNTHSLLYTTPITKFSYLGGRFAGSMFITLLVFSGIALGFALGTQMPYLDAEKFGPFSVMSYIQPYLVSVIPNIFFTGALFFTLAALTRSVLATYVGSVLFLVLYGVAQTLTADLDNKEFASIIDALGIRAVSETTKYWTVAEKNNLLVPFSGLLMINRVLWSSIGAVIFILGYKKFSFSYFAGEKGSGKKKPVPAAKTTQARPVQFKLALPAVHPEYSFSNYIRQLFSLSRIEFLGIIKSIYFISIVFAGVVFLLVSGSQVGKMYDTTTFPVTREVMEVLGGTFSLFMLIIIIFYSGELVWKERQSKMEQIADALPVPNWLGFISKLSALIAVQFILLFVVMFCGIVVQTFKGYYHYEIGLYLQELIGFQFIDYVLLCVLAMFVQVTVNHKFAGHFVVIVFYLFIQFSGLMGIEHPLFKYGSDTGTPYSDMNGYGHFVFPFFLFKLYWASVAFLLAVASNLLWVRGSETTLRWRARLGKERINMFTYFLIASALAVFAGSGGWIYYNTNVLNEYQTSKEAEEQQAEYEKKYKKYEDIPQPRIIGVKVNADLFPNERNIFLKGSYLMKNKTGTPIDSIHLNVITQIDIKRLGFNRETKKVYSDTVFGYYIYRFIEPLLPGDSVTLFIDLAGITKGFPVSGGNTSIVYNGSFINSGLMPSIGYSEQGELSEDDARKKYGLPKKERMAKVDDLKARQNTYISDDADWITFESIVSTVPDQIAIAPGYLQKEWIEKNRRYFYYKMDSKILCFYSFLSARYEVKKAQWKNPADPSQPVNIEIYYHKGHEYNLDRMIKGVKKSLDYFTRNFSPYQHRQVRILEFPGYAAFAQAFPNTIPFSESIGFIADVDTTDPEDVDYPFYITAHEVAHQWWAHQVIGGNVQGSTLMSETMAQYSALMVMEKEYGKDKMKKFLKYELDNYLRSRSFERKKELPLYLVENQPYIHYRKGSVVMYALKDYIGEDSLNAAIRNYVQAVAFQEPPYTNSIEFLTYIKAAVPDSLRNIITDMFETITLYENKTDSVNYKEVNGKYVVKINTDCKKFRSDSIGNETDVPINDWIDVAVITRKKVDGKWKDVELYFEKRKINKQKMEFEITVNEKPTKAGIDPYNKLIDRNPDDNVKEFKTGKIAFGQ